MSLEYEVIAKDKTGKVIARLKSEAHSWLKQYNQMVYGGMSGSPQSVEDIGGVNRTQSVTYDLMNIWEIAGDDTRGPVVGSGSTAVDINDHRLDTQIPHGTGPGQLNHLATDVIYPPTVSGSECYFHLKKVFVNLSGAAITVREIGIYARISSAGNACIARDVLPVGVNIPDGGSITVIYRVRAIA